jgi:hypothetical protein
LVQADEDLTKQRTYLDLCRGSPHTLSGPFAWLRSHVSTPT